MKSYYQPHGGKKGPFTLRDNTYRRMVYLIADYDYFVAVSTGLIDMEKFKDERHSEPEDNAISRSNFDQYIKAINDAKKAVPDIYVDDVMDHIINKTKYSNIPAVHENTLKKWVQRFIWQVAKNLGEI